MDHQPLGVLESSQLPVDRHQFEQGPVVIGRQLPHGLERAGGGVVLAAIF